MSAGERIVAGRGCPMTGCIMQLALRVADAAKALGLKVEVIRSSRSWAGSPSKYIYLLDPSGRSWLIRVSNHYRPRSSWHAKPHCDLVSLDGRSGIERVQAWLHHLIAGSLEWFDPAATERPPARRRSKLKPKGRKPI